MPQVMHLPLPMRAVAGAGLEAQSAVGAAVENASEGDVTVAEIAINSSNNSHSNSDSIFL